MELLPDDEFTIDQVYKRCGINGNSIRSVISRAIKKGLINRVNDNKGNNEAAYIKTENQEGIENVK
jgi:predicted transcriptional regulator of viral defense system